MSKDNIVRVVQQAGLPHPPAALGHLIDGQCEGSKFHSPAPLLVRPLYLENALGTLFYGEETRPGEDLVYLCGNCWDNLTVYLWILYAYNGATPYAVRRDFGNLVRDLGDRAWQHRIG